MNIFEYLLYTRHFYKWRNILTNMSAKSSTSGGLNSDTRLKENEINSIGSSSEHIEKSTAATETWGYNLSKSPYRISR